MRLIDADLLEKYLKRDEWCTPDEKWRAESEFGAMIDAQPTVDAKEVVMCKDCVCATYIHKKDGSIVPFRCEKFSLFNIADMTYCSWGIRIKAKVVKEKEEK